MAATRGERGRRRIDPAKPEDLELVEVEWDDSALFGIGWDDISAYVERFRDDDCRCRSVGWLIADEAKGILISGHLDANAKGGIQVNTAMAIPRRAIRSIHHLRRQQARPRRRLDVVRIRR